jgi:hypothetical protein
MARHWWKWLLVLPIIALLAWGYDRTQMIAWVGGIDLEVEFVVTEADTGRPIPSARVEVQSEGGFYEEGEEPQPFDLVADADGVARKECRESMCFGKQSGLLFTNTFSVHLPWWRFQVSAADYQPTEWVELDVPDYSRRVQRSGPSKARLVVPVSLLKSPD